MNAVRSLLCDSKIIEIDKCIFFDELDFISFENSVAECDFRKYFTPL